MTKEKTNPISHPLQSKEWGEFRKAWGNKILLTKYGLITIHKIPFTKYSLGMFIKGPEPTKEVVKELKKIGTKENLIFIKLEPNTGWRLPLNSAQISNRNKLTKLLKSEGAVSGKTLFTPTTFRIDLSKTEGDLLKSFSSKTRYNIRLAQKHGVVVGEDNSDYAFNRYLYLTRETVSRQGFFAHTEKYHRLMWKYLNQLPISNNQLPIARLLIAKYKNEIITAWILFVFNNFLYYPYGASSDKYKGVMANNLMMWEAIKIGKKLGLKTFDLWGREEGKGFTKFKEGYNPEVVEFLGTWDLVINKPLYKIYRLAEGVRWKLLRLRAKISPVKPTF